MKVVAVVRDLFFVARIRETARLVGTLLVFARTPEEIAAATAAWRAGEFGPVGSYQGEPLPAPPLDVARLKRPR